MSAEVKRGHREAACEVANGDKCRTWDDDCFIAGELPYPKSAWCINERIAQALADLEQATEARVRAEELAPWKRLASSIVEAEEAGDVVFRQCAWSSEWSAEFYRLARAIKAAHPELGEEELSHD